MKTIEAIASKSDAHRALIGAALSEKKCNVVFNTTSEDIKATERCLKSLIKGEKELYCGESGSTLRFLLPVTGALGRECDFYPEGRLPDRPLSPLYEEMEKKGCRLSPQGTVPFKIRGKLNPGDYSIPGNVSSQFISGLLFALPLLNGNSRILIKGKQESRNYISMTMKTLEKFGIIIEQNEEGFLVKGNQKYRGPENYLVEGDWSNSAFFLSAGAVSSDSVRMTGLNLDSVQGDREILKVLKSFGAGTETGEDSITVSPGRLRGIKINAEQIPDMVPAIAALACRAEGETVITGAGRLRIKESDRLESISDVVRKLGGEITELEEGLVINGKGSLKGGTVSSHGDHRIAMMAAVMSLYCENKVIIEGSNAVNKSYPGFFRDMEKLNFDGNLERK